MAVERNNYASFKEYPGPIKRQGPFNIDTTAMYTSREAALAYAKTNPAAYDGQILTVTETNADGSTALYYFGIKNATNTNADGTTTIEPQLMQIMTLLDAQNLLYDVGALKYKGTLAVIQQADPSAPEFVHSTFEALFGGIYQNPESGNMYNVYFSDANGPQEAHMYNMLNVITPYSEGFDVWQPTDESVVLTDKVEVETADGTKRYGVQILLGSPLHGILPPFLEKCWNYLIYTSTDDPTTLHPIFYDTYEYGIRSFGNLGVCATVTLLIADPVDRLEEMDGWAKSHIIRTGEGQTLAPIPATDKEVYDQLNIETLASMGMAFAGMLRNGDNIVYNGKFWDVLSGTIDLAPYATKEELITAVSNSTSIYRQE